MSPVAPLPDSPPPKTPRRRPPSRRRRLLSTAAFVGSFAALLGIVLWLQDVGSPVTAAPAVHIVGASTSTATAAPGDVVTLTSLVRNDGAALPDITVELEVRADDGRLMLRSPRRGVRLDQGHDQNVAWVWRLPNDLPPGRYRADVTVYGPNWSPQYARLESGAGFFVEKR
jgi:hypothetical protein